jgi:alpha-tubulin suppressor-like RCC1 family protein
MRLLQPSSLVPVLSVLTVTVALTSAQAPGGVPEAARAPIQVPGVDDVIEAAIGEHLYLVLRRDGHVLSWGYNNFGQLGNGTVGATAGSEPGKTLGFVVQGRAAPVVGLIDVTSIAAGGEHALAVTRDGSVWGWGSNGSGQLGLGRANHGVSARPVKIPGIERAVAVAARSSTSYALLADGTVLGWGDRLWRANGRAVSSETPTRVPGVADAVAIRAGLPSLALLKDGHMLAWGGGILGDGSPAQRDYAAVQVPQPVRVQGVDDAVAIASGASMAAVIRRDGSAWVWGENGNSGLGAGPSPAGASTDVLAPIRLPGISNAEAIAVASGSSIVGKDGTLRTWGDMRLGATGRPGNLRVLQPTPVAGVSNLVRVWGTNFSNLGLTRDGHVLAWGSVYVAP